MNIKLAFVMLMLLSALALSGCAWYGGYGDYPYYYDDGYGYGRFYFHHDHDRGFDHFGHGDRDHH